MASINYNNKKTFKERLIFLCLKDMDKSDITSLMLYGFKGFEQFTEEELIESVIDRYELKDDHNQNQVYTLTKRILKETLEEILN